MEEPFEDFDPQVPKDAVFLPAQMSAIQETVSASVNEALWVFNNHEAQAHFPGNLRTPGPRMLYTATPLGLHRPLDKSLEDKVHCLLFITARLHVSLPGHRSAVAL